MLRPLAALKASIRSLTLTRALACGHGGPPSPVYILKASTMHVETGGSDAPSPTLFRDHHVHNHGPPTTSDFMPVLLLRHLHVHEQVVQWNFIGSTLIMAAALWNSAENGESDRK
ncbi:hypothetical protein L596_001255 [Steinernema carpocapsae]|uniref:Uncharacterized protein n=1 Tax=Steinernema carpocapsae TaxID=34508 RepID=A0A4V6I716_STECR|nr:hypothetical protein L596_001255 [Steinernema carpocapsae]